MLKIQMDELKATRRAILFYGTALVLFLVTMATVALVTPRATGDMLIASTSQEVAADIAADVPAEDTEVVQEDGVFARIMQALSGGKSGWGFAVLFLLTTVYTVVSKTRYKGHVDWALGLLWEGAEVPLAVLNHIKDPKSTTSDEVIKECKDVVVIWKQRSE